MTVPLVAEFSAWTSVYGRLAPLPPVAAAQAGAAATRAPPLASSAVLPARAIKRLSVRGERNTRGSWGVSGRVKVPSPYRAGRVSAIYRSGYVSIKLSGAYPCGDEVGARRCRAPAASAPGPGRGAPDDQFRLEQQLSRRDRAALDLLDQRAHHGPAHRVDGLADGGQRRIRAGHQRRVVVAHHGDVP